MVMLSYCFFKKLLFFFVSIYCGIHLLRLLQQTGKGKKAQKAAAATKKNLLQSPYLLKDWDTIGVKVSNVVGSVAFSYYRRRLGYSMDGCHFLICWVFRIWPRIPMKTTLWRLKIDCTRRRSWNRRRRRLKGKNIELWSNLLYFNLYSEIRIACYVIVFVGMRIGWVTLPNQPMSIPHLNLGDLRQI